MKVLTINSGSSSVKYQFIDTDTKQSLCKGLIERIGISGTNLTHKRHDGIKPRPLITSPITNLQSNKS